MNMDQTFMINRIASTIIFMIVFTSCKSQVTEIQKDFMEQNIGLTTSFEKDMNSTATYSEAIAFYKRLDEGDENLKVREYGMTDSGYPLHEVVVTNDGEFDPLAIRKKGKTILFINNAIHPGEPCGVDASMMLARDLLQNNMFNYYLNFTTVVIVPVYNISGALNRGSHSRANQDGPHAYGFRGNARNYDLNRDFIKSDTENARSFNRLFTKWKPDVMIDNHTSNGADYQYVMTLIPTQKDKMEPILAAYMQEEMLPFLYDRMSKSGYEMTPYVYARSTPDEGIYGFLDLPRYSSGYASLHNTISFMPETHMLKPYKDRVWSTYFFMESMLRHISRNKDELLKVRSKAAENTKVKRIFDIQWALDPTVKDTLTFKGYQAKYKPSEIHGKDRLYYDHESPYEKEVPFFNTYKATLKVERPTAYIIPRAYKQIVDKMKDNGVEVMRLNKNEVKDVEVYRIKNFETVDVAYEGHYLHSGLEVEKTTESIQYFRGDYIVYVNQELNNYIVHTLEPQSPDSWFSWNFFDGILMQKEHFSSYVFEDLAVDILNNDPQLKKNFLSKKKEDKEFASDARAQLNYIYQRSPHFEPTFKRYPVGRWMK